MSERWFDGQMYCPVCSNNDLSVYPNNYPVADFFCPDCNESYQLKSQSKKFAGKVTDGAYSPMINSISSDTLPNFFFLHYDKSAYDLVDLLFVPRFFISESIIEKRNPLSSSARRAGWTGCNILFCKLADEGKIKVVEDGREIPKGDVRQSWRKISFIGTAKADSRGWINDIMWCVNQLGRKEFTLKEIYAFEGQLKKLHPDNNNIQPKIRQQLQFLRNQGYLRFLGAGKYALIN